MTNNAYPHIGGTLRQQRWNFSPEGRAPVSPRGNASAPLGIPTPCAPALSTATHSAVLLPAPRAAVQRLVPVRILSPRPFEPPEDATRLIIDFATGTLLELLATALVDRQFHVVARQRLSHELRWLGTKPGAAEIAPVSRPDLMELLVPQVAQKFVDLPSLTLRSPGVTDDQACMELPCSAFAPFGEDEALLHCQDCNTPILKANDVISSNYRIMTGRAFLTTAVYNVNISEDTQEAIYTTGQYTVRHVDCAQCRLRLGITYVGALDRGNQYKIGKFLVGQHFFVRPTCCSLRTRPLASELPMPLCPRCERNGARGVLHLVHRLTHGLRVCHTRRLYELMLQEQAAEELAVEGILLDQGGSARSRSRSRAFMAWCLPLLRPQPSHGGAASGERPRLQCLRTTSRAASPVVPPTSPSAALREGQVGREGLEEPGLRLENSLSASVRSSLALNANSWQESLKARLAMLSCLQSEIHKGERLHSSLSAIVRFIGVFCRVARRVAPLGANAPERVASLLQLLPALVRPGRTDAYHGARALVLAVRKEWVVSSSSSSGNDPAGALSAGALEAIVRAITVHTAASLGESQARRASEPCATGVPPEHTSARVPHSSRTMPATSRARRSVASECSPCRALHSARTPRLTAASRRNSSWLRSMSRETDLAEAEPVITDSSSDGEEVLQQDEANLQCLACGVPILQVDDILSSSYRITTSPAYLTRQAHNIIFGEESHEVMYTSGQYTVRDIACACCSARLGVAYVGAVNAVNQHKVGKFLMGQDRLFVPSSMAAPTDEASLHGHLLELAHGHGGIQVPLVAPGPEPEEELFTARTSSARDAYSVSRAASPRASPVPAPSVSPSPTSHVSRMPTTASSRSVVAPPPSLANSAGASVVTEAAIQEQVPASAMEHEIAPSVNSASLQNPRPSQQLFVVVTRFMQCILPPVQHAPTAVPPTNSSWGRASVPALAGSSSARSLGAATRSPGRTLHGSSLTPGTAAVRMHPSPVHAATHLRPPTHLQANLPGNRPLHVLRASD